MHLAPLQALITLTALLCLALPAPAAHGSDKETGSIVVTLKGIDVGQGGEIVVLLYEGGDAWLEQERASARKTVPAAAAAVSVTFAGVPYGDAYAVQVFHDRNGNGRMDMRWFPYPKPAEGAGVSNNVLRFGPPEYARARFALDGPTAALRIELSY